MKNDFPDYVKSLFWDCDINDIDVEKHQDFIIRRVLDRGEWSAVKWLRKDVGDDAIRNWLLKTKGKGLEPRKINFWGIILNIPENQVAQLVESANQSTWNARVRK